MKLSEICEVNPKGLVLDSNTNVSFVAMPDVSEDGKISTSDIRKYHEVKKGYTSFIDGDVLLAKITPCMENGKGALATGLINGIGFGSTEFHVLRPLYGKADGKWLYYFTVWPGFRKDAERNMTGSAGQKRVPKDFLEKYDLFVPPLEMQRLQVQQLDSIKGLIDLRKSQLSYCDHLIKARFVEMFGDPATNPNHWIETTIGRECYYIKDGPHKSLPDIGKDNGGHPFISVRNIVNHTIDFTTARYVSDEDYLDARKKCCPEKGDMLYSKGGTTGIAKLIDVDIEFANWVHLAVLKYDHNELDGIFFENMLNSEYCYDQSQRLTKGIANKDLVLSAMAKIKMYKPPINLQTQFATFVAQVNKTKSVIQKSLDETQLLFDSLMQQYFG